MTININQLINIMKLSAQLILENGGETYRAEETVEYIGRSAGAKEVDSFATPTGIHITVSMDGMDNYSAIKRIGKRTINLDKLHRVNSLSRAITNGQVSLEQAELELEKIRNLSPPPPSLDLFYGALTSAFFAVLFHGGPFDFCVALVSGFLVALINQRLSTFPAYHFISNLFCGMVIALLAIGGTSLAGFGNQEAIILGGMMPQLPGIAMTNAIRDTIRGDLVSGVARAAEALLISASLAVGSGIVMSLAYGLNLG